MLFLRKLPSFIVAVVVSLAFLANSNEARADFKLRISTDGGATFGADIEDDDSDGFIDTTLGTLVIQAFAISDGSFTVLDLSVLSGNANLTGENNIVIQATYTGITTAPAPQTLTNYFSGGSIPNTATLTTQTWVDNNNTLYGEGPGEDIVLDTGTLSLGDGITPNFVSNFPGVPLYSLTTQISIRTSSDFDGTIAGDSMNIITPAPAPGGLVLAIGGVPFLLAGLRRRMRASQNSSEIAA